MVSLQAVVLTLALSGAGETVLLDFSADWCGPCREMEPAVRQLAQMGYPVRQINIDDNQALARKFGVESIPCFVMLVDGREVGRVVGRTDMGRLQAMCEQGRKAEAEKQRRAAATRAAKATPPVDTPIPAVTSGAPLRQIAGPRSMRPVAPAADASVPNDALIAASVRLRVIDATGRSCGSGTIIDARNGEALILTCAHLFRDSQGKGRIEIDLFGPTPARGIPGRLKSYNLDREVALVVFQPPGPVVSAPVAKAGVKFRRGDQVTAIGCSHGNDPTAHQGQIASVDRYLGAPNLQVTGGSIDGRSGGGMFAADGRVIGVCYADDADASETMCAALGAIHAELEDSRLAFVFRDDAPLVAIADPPPMPRRMPLAAVPSPPAGAPGSFVSHETSVHGAADRQDIGQPLRAEIMGMSQGAEVICILRSLSTPWAKSRLIVLDRASPAFLQHLIFNNSGQPGTAAKIPVPTPRGMAQAAAQLSRGEQAVLAEIGSVPNRADVICIVRPLDRPQADSRVFAVDKASGAFIEQLTAETRAQDMRRLTSLAAPKTLPNSPVVLQASYQGAMH
ncbi:MAG: trypsin-like peptidase domain-containing protein [Planctomycetes bacterium]|nr:trypsin-like peptidase domain-containing protein [Planctomycetota bacterium]